MDGTNKKGLNSASKLRILGFNANSIGKNPKRRKVLHFLSKKNPDFTFIFDTRICPSIEKVITEEWGGECLFSSLNSQSRGVALFIKKNTSGKILDKKVDGHGNVLAALLEFEGKKILLEGLYGPNEDCPFPQSH